MQRNTRSAAASVTHQRGRPGRSIDTCLRSFSPKSCSVGASTSSPMQAAMREAGSGHDHRAIRSRAGLEGGTGFQGVGIEQRDAGAAAVGDQDLSVVGDRAGHARKSRQRCDVPAGVVVDHLDAIARGVGNEDAPALRIEGGVIELAAGGAGYGDGSDCFQRHDGLTAARAPSVALTTIGERDKRKTALASSTRNLLEHRVLRRAWTGRAV